jgi:hypothetical protein
MKPNANPDNLDRLLREWQVEEPLPPRFQEQVWSRIVLAEAKAPNPVWNQMLGRLAAFFERPKFAYSYAAALLAVGIAAGSWTAHVKTSRWETDLGQRYLQTLNPYQQEVASR